MANIHYVVDLSIQYKYLVPVSTLVDVAFTLNTLKHQGFKLAGWHPVFDTIFQHEGITIRILSYLSYLHTCGSMLMPSHVSQTATFPTTLPSAMDSMSKSNQYNQCIQISGKHIQCTHLEKHWVICDIQPEIEPPDQALPLRDTSLHGLTDFDRLRMTPVSGSFRPALFVLLTSLAIESGWYLFKRSCGVFRLHGFTKLALQVSQQCPWGPPLQRCDSGASVGKAGHFAKLLPPPWFPLALPHHLDGPLVKNQRHQASTRPTRLCWEPKKQPICKILVLVGPQFAWLSRWVLFSSKQCISLIYTPCIII
jgi:hypothetical protein